MKALSLIQPWATLIAGAYFRSGCGITRARGVAVFYWTTPIFVRSAMADSFENEETESCDPAVPRLSWAIRVECV